MYMFSSMVIDVVIFIYTIIVAFFYFKRSRIKNIDNKIYSYLTVLSIIGLITEFICNFTGFFNYSENSIIVMFFSKLLLIVISLWVILYTLYINFISFNKITFSQNEKNNNILKNIFVLFLIFISILLFILPINYVKNNGVAYSTGLSVELVYILCLIGLIIDVYSILKNLTKVKKKNIASISILILFTLFLFIIRQIIPEFNIIFPVFALTNFILYFTIENPDVKMIEELNIAKDQAEKANNVKTDFLSNMSHEIRTPLNAIVGFSEMLKEDNIPDTSKEKVNDIIMASNNLLDIVNGILDISKIEANKLEIINKEYDIKNILDELIALTKARIGDKGLEFRYHIDEDIPRVLYGDSIRLKQIILNILTNAVKYTKEGYIDFKVSSVKKDNICRLIISVEDTGIGIKQEDIPKIFSKFERLGVEKQITIEGTGLGLAITKKLVELMNGKIVVQSVYGKGSKFTISIDQRIISVNAPTIVNTTKSESKVVDASGYDLLLVDDNELNIKVATVLLKKYHFNIDSCLSGFECLEKIESGKRYDIIFMDDMMPKMSGRETLKKLKKIANFDTPVIALTANAITGMKEEYLACGFDDYIPKPIEKTELERIIKEFLKKKNIKYSNTKSSNVTESVLNKTLPIELPSLSSNNKKVLLVDDDEINLKIGANTLKKLSFDVTISNSGEDAISKVIETKYDVIFLDDVMPGMNGPKTLDELKTIDNFNTPVVMVTASTYEDVKDKLKEHGFNGYLSKPFKVDDITNLLNDILNK